MKQPIKWKDNFNRFTSVSKNITLYQKNNKAMKNLRQADTGKVMLLLTVSQSAYLGVQSTSELETRHYFLSEYCCVVSVGHPL
jgi:hypothetical protein